MLVFSKKSRGQMMREELGSSWEHLLQAATLVANGMGSSIGPRASKVRLAAERGWETSVGPLAIAYRQGAADARATALKLSKRSKAAKKGRQMGNRRVGMLVGLLAAGAAVGAACALVMRRRKREGWSEYEPTEALEGVSGEARSMMEKAGSKVDTAKEKAADKLESAASSLRRTDPKGRAQEASEAVDEATDELSSSYSPPSKHSGRF
jgi:hypothetical protein